MAGLVVDAGPLIALDRGDAIAWAYLKRAHQRFSAVVVPAPVLAQAWRGSRNARLSLALRGLSVEPLSAGLARETGELCGAAHTSDIVDACVVALAARLGYALLTTEGDDLRALAAHRPSAGTVIDF